jgi:hypothetical protein
MNTSAEMNVNGAPGSTIKLRDPTSYIFNTDDTWKYHAELLAI